MRSILKSACSVLLLIGFSSCSSSLFTPKAPLELEQAWSTDNVFRTPESVLHDPERNIIYVTNINRMSGTKKDGDGYISKLSPNGEVEQLYWVTGLNDPKGMALHNNVLYVSDVNEIVAVSTQSGGVLGRYEAEKAEFLNDVAVDNDGNVYVTDTDQKRIYMLRNGRVSTWLKNTNYNRPNGIYFDDSRMVVAFDGDVRFLDPDTQKWTSWTDGIKDADGIAKIADGFLVSSWEGEVYFVNPEGKNWRVLNTKSKNVNAADISYSDKLGLLLVPTFNDNRVVAYRIKR